MLILKGLDLMVGRVNRNLNICFNPVMSIRVSGLGVQLSLQLIGQEELSSKPFKKLQNDHN